MATSDTNRLISFCFYRMKAITVIMCAANETLFPIKPVFLFKDGVSVCLRVISASCLRKKFSVPVLTYYNDCMHGFRKRAV